MVVGQSATVKRKKSRFLCLNREKMKHLYFSQKYNRRSQKGLVDLDGEGVKGRDLTVVFVSVL